MALTYIHTWQAGRLYVVLYQAHVVRSTLPLLNAEPSLGK